MDDVNDVDDVDEYNTSTYATATNTTAAGAVAVVSIDDNDVIQSYFDDAQGVLQTSREAEVDAGRMRQELSMFLTESMAKVDSEGNSLISMPDNFDAVVDAMNRDDVVSTDERPWSKYLLSSANELGGFEKSFTDRYNDFIDDTKETKVQIGLAEIHLLDKQLGLLLRKEAILSHQDQSETQTDDGSETLLTNRSNVTTPRSVMSKRDATFLTRTNKTSTVGARSEKSSPSSPKRTSVYSEANEDTDHYEQRDYDKDDDDSKKKKRNKNFLKQNIDRLGSKSLLSKEEDDRVRQLLEDDVENQPNLQEYGYTLDLLEYDKQLDAELVSYGHLDRLIETHDRRKTSLPSSSSSSSKNRPPPDYLTEQREQREHQEYVSKIDRMLETVTSDLMDLSEMIRPTTRSSDNDNDNDDNNDNNNDNIDSDGRSKYSLEVPSIDEIRTGKRISVDDVMHVVNLAIQEIGQDADVNLSEHRREIDRLLGGLKNEIDRLSSLRRKSQYYRGISSPFHKSVDTCSQSSLTLLNNQDLEYDHHHDAAAAAGNYYDDNDNDYNNDDNNDDDDDDEIIMEESVQSHFLPQVPGSSSIKSRPTSSSSSDSKDARDDITLELPQIMQHLSRQIASVKAAAATKNKLFINRVSQKKIKEEIRKVTSSSFGEGLP